jgi:PAS domain S-box-containing protein
MSEELRQENERLHLEVESLRRRLEEAEETVHAIRAGQVDAVVVEGEHDSVLTLEDVYRPYRLLVERVTEGAATLTCDGAILYCNRRFADMLMWPQKSLIGRSLRDYTAADDHPAVVALLREAEGGSVQSELRLRRSDGEWVDVYLGATPVQEGAVGTCLMVTDLTQQKQYEQLVAAESLARSLLAELREADRRKDEFLAMLAHELRGPLAPLRNMLEFMTRARDDGAQLDRAVATMQRQLDHLVRLVDDLLDISRITRDKIELRKQTVELASILYQSAEVCRPLAESANHRMTIKLPDEPVYLDADPVRLTQVFSNLLNNACKYTEPGGSISVIAEQNGNEVVVKVKDSGVGISPEKLTSIFEMFAQVDQTLERSQGGLGIGLTLVKRLVEMHGGSVEAASAGKGQGSEFTVRLPIAAEKTNAVPPPHRVEPRPIGGRRILIVDDNADAATSLAMLLKITGNETRTAYDGLAALKVSESFRPEIVLLDIGLPKLNGYEVCRRLRAEPWGQDVMLVAMTGWGQDEDRRKTSEAGFDEHVVKPIEYAALVKLLAQRQSASSDVAQAPVAG